MASELPVGEVVGEFLQSILASPKRQRRLLSKTFWEKFGFKARTKARIVQVREALKAREVHINLDDAAFGMEDKDDWIVLTLVEPPAPNSEPVTGAGDVERAPETIPRPSAAWFEQMEQKHFESEREVEYFFIAPLLEALGYEEQDFAVGYPVQMYEGVHKVNKEADLVLFDGERRDKDSALLVIEAKRANGPITSDAVGQARGYAIWLKTPYYAVISPEEVQVHLFRGYQPDVQVMKFGRQQLGANWEAFYAHLNKAAVLDRKAQLSGGPR